jgi:2-methylisocitrate lyase-like PEP mutase family enzyme
MNPSDMISSLKIKGEAFRALHAAPGIFEVPNPWDVGSALQFEKLGAKALATSSGASAVAIGLRDGRIGRERALAHARDVCAATRLPVTADLENGFGDTPEHAAETIRMAGETGLVGGSIEDYCGNPDGGIYPLELAAERVRAAAEAAHALPFPFLLTARCENFLRGIEDLADTIKRLQAYEAAGADVLFAPALPNTRDVQTVCNALGKPFNFMVGVPGKSFSRAQLQAAGVKRISFGTVFYRVAMAASRAAAREALESGTYSFVNR